MIFRAGAVDRGRNRLRTGITKKSKKGETMIQVRT